MTRLYPLECSGLYLVLSEPHVTCCAQNFNVLLSRHNPSTDKHAHFLVQPRQVAKERSTPVPMRKVCCGLAAGFHRLTNFQANKTPLLYNLMHLGA